MFVSHSPKHETIFFRRMEHLDVREVDLIEALVRWWGKFQLQNDKDDPEDAQKLRAEILPDLQFKKFKQPLADYCSASNDHKIKPWIFADHPGGKDSLTFSVGAAASGSSDNQEVEAGNGVQDGELGHAGDDADGSEDGEGYGGGGHDMQDGDGEPFEHVRNSFYSPCAHPAGTFIL
jgi:hypothetical protein